MSGKLEPFRRILGKKPFIFIRDLFVQMAWHIDPDLTALQWQVLEIALSQTRKGQPFSWMMYDRLYRRVHDHLKNDKEWRYGPEKSWLVALGPLSVLDYLGERSQIRALDFGCGGHFSDSTGLILYLCGLQSIDCLELERVISGFETGATLELAHWIEDQLMVNAFMPGSPDVKIDETRLEQMHRAALPASLGQNNLIPVKLIVGDISQMNWEDGRYDLITSNAVLEHVTNPPKIWGELKRLVKVGGILHHIIDFRDHRYYYDPNGFVAMPVITSLADWSDPGTNGWRYMDWLKMIESDPTLKIIESRPRLLNGSVVKKRSEDGQTVASCEFVVRKDK